MNIRRWTPLTFVAPRRYLEAVPFETDHEFRTWASDHYEWTQDPWNGLRDFAKRPADTIETGRGDCEDFALVALSWAVSDERPSVGIGFCWAWPTPWPTHAIAFDDESVYSSGSITEESVDEWLDGSQYDYVLKRRVR